MRQAWKFCFRALTAFDAPLLLLLVILTAIGLTNMYSAVGGFEHRFSEQVRNFILTFCAMWAMAMVAPKQLMRMAPWVYGAGIVLLLGVEFFGQTSKGATRWLGMGSTRIQPSEMMKIAVPMMLAWHFQRNEGHVRARDFLAAAALLALPLWLIVAQPDLGTALLVCASGFFVLYFAGLPFKLLVPVATACVVGLGALLYYEDELCQSGVDWVVLHEYQKHRVCTLLDPSSDPLGRSFHTIQSMIAVGSGGLYGQGFMQGTQTHLDFVPERETDFIFAVFAEDFGLYGGVLLLTIYALIIARGLLIAANSTTHFGRLLAGSLSMTMTVYVFVNIGMVTGILPVVGVPLPFMSYGGTALLTTGLACGILMSISRYRGRNS